MTKPVSHTSSDVYGDFASLEKLKGTARHSASAMRQVAKQFESVFARMMIKSMRDAIGKDPIFGSDQAQTYQSMFDDQLSMDMTRGRGLGLADMLMRQLQGSSAAAESANAASTTTAPAPAATGSTLAPTRPPVASSADQASFIQQVWPQAQAAGQELGVAPVSLVAQAALETNWGKSVPHSAGGETSNNLFGIKAGGSWDGPSVVARTQEFANGSPGTVAAPFRAYSSPSESFQDYVALLRSNPRYSGALNSGNDVHAFAAALQQGGYASDPNYARKVSAVAQQVTSTLVGSVMSLKFAGSAPLNGAKDA